MIKAGIMGSTGYAGGELARLLLQREDVEITWYGSRSYVDQPYASIFQNMKQFVGDDCKDDNMEALAEAVDVIFTATPQGFCASLMNEKILSKAKVIDLSADYRIKDVAVYEQWYKMEHKTPEYIKEAVYGLPEINREAVKHARLIANPGCYPTCSFLSVYPLVKEGLIDPNTIIIDAKSGTSGAGRGAKIDNLYCEVNENMKAYGVAVHRHTPEIEEQLSLAAGKPVTISFTPHLVPMNRGLLSTVKLPLAKGAAAPDPEELAAIQQRFYANSPLVEALPAGSLPKTASVAGTARAQVGVAYHAEARMIIAIGAIDNLGKGAAGQAVQCANIIFGLDQTEGLTSLAVGV